MKILYITTVGSTMNFFENIINILLKEGHYVDIATNETERKVSQFFRDRGCKIYHLDCSRTPLKIDNVRAIKQIKKIVLENGYDIIHCHTPIAGACTRLACQPLRKYGIKVFYTAHGFHFYKGAPLLNWLIYYPVEKICAYFTDTLITINREDYALAKKKMKAKHVEYVPGVGINIDKFKKTVVDRETKRKELGIPKDAILLVSVGELNANKNHQIVIQALAELKDYNIHYAIAGEGPLEKILKDLSKELKIKRQVHLLGYRNDVAEIYKCADVCCFPSIREGLPVSVMEAMACGLPLVVADNRGTRDLVISNSNSVICNCHDKEAWRKAIHQYVKAGKTCNEKENLSYNFDVKNVNKKMKEVYGV